MRGVFVSCIVIIMVNKRKKRKEKIIQRILLRSDINQLSVHYKAWDFMVYFEEIV